MSLPTSGSSHLIEDSTSKRHRQLLSPKSWFTRRHSKSPNLSFVDSQFSSSPQSRLSDHETQNVSLAPQEVAQPSSTNIASADKPVQLPAENQTLDPRVANAPPLSSTDRLSLPATDAHSEQSSNSSVGHVPPPVTRTENRMRKTIATTLDVSLGRGSHRSDVFNIRWQKPSEFGNVKKAAERLLQDKGLYVEHDPSTRLYLQTGSAKLLRTADNAILETCFLDDDRDWQNELQRIILLTLSKEILVDFHLAITWNFVLLKIHRQKDEPLKDAIRDTIETHFRSNFRQQDFLPRKAIETIFDQRTVRDLIYEDKSLSDSLFPQGPSSWARKSEFADHIFNHCIPLLALFIHAKMHLRCLYHLIINTEKQKEHPLRDRPLVKEDCPDGERRADFNPLTTMQSKFYAHTFYFEHGKRRRTHDILDEAKVVPVMFNKSEDSSKLGKGAFGDVYKARIHAEHHNFDSDRRKSYALKIFRHRNEGKDSVQEEEALQKLAALPHENLVLHLAAWTQDETFYMLFECAEKNLRNHMTLPAPHMTGTFAKDLLQQLRNISAAVEHIHKIAPAGLGPTEQAITDKDTLKVGPSLRRSTGFHYDLKPENILLFRDAGGKSMTWKVSDFGTTRIHEIVSGSGTSQHQYRSHKTRSLSQGDPVYCAPDWVLRGETSRPYDIWSLGCVFLEVLLWAFHIEGWQTPEFEMARVLSPPKGHQTPAFWYQKNDKIGLKPAVTSKLMALQTNCEQYGVFADLVTITANMLRLEPEDRPRAAVIVSDIEGLQVQAELDLQQDADFYDGPRGRNHHRYVAVPSDTGRRQQPRGFMDTHLVDASYDSDSGPDQQPHTPHHRKQKSAESLAAKQSIELSDSDSPGRVISHRHDGLHLSPIQTEFPLRGRKSRSPSVTKTTPDGKVTTEVEPRQGDTDSQYSGGRSQVGSQFDSMSQESLPKK